MKLYDKKKVQVIGLSIIVGMLFSAYLLYEQKGKLGKIELITLCFTFLLAIFISVIIIRKGNKK